MEDYKPRIADQLLEDSLEALGAVLVQGIKWCGKTTTSAHHSKSVLYVDNPGQIKQNIQLAETNPQRLLEGETPRLIDEWELVPQLWDAARYEVDHRSRHTGQFIFTGSSVPRKKKSELEKINHSGTGRFDRLTMRTMSLWESGDSSGNVSLSALFEGVFPDGESKIDLDRLAFLTCRGGWPGSLSLNEKAALRVSKSYLKNVTDYDISRIDDVQRDSDFMRRIIRSLARNQGCQVPVTTIFADLSQNNQHCKTEETIEDYIKVLKGIFLEEDMPAWNPNLRSRTAIRTTDTRYFVDPSIATAALAISPKDLINDLKSFGFFFETMAVRDLRVYASALEGNVYHYRDKNGLECDAVIHLDNGKYGLIEIKLGGDSAIEDGASTLKSLADKIDTTKMPQPSFLMVLVGVGQYAYRRQDGVCVVPIGCLKQ